MATNRENLKEYFKAGDRPTESEFAELIDNSVNVTDDKANQAEAAAGNNDSKYMTPSKVKNSIDANVPTANTTTQGKIEIATLTEVQLGTDSERAVTPAGAKRSVETFSPVKSVNGQTGNVNLETIDRGSMRMGIAKHFTTADNTTDIFHIKLPYRTDVDNKMFYLKATGYAYLSAEIIDVTWVGYCYTDGGLNNNFIKTNTTVLGATTITAGQYIGTNKHIYLWFKLSNVYYSTFKIDSMYVGNGTLLENNSVQIIQSSQIKL